MSNQNVCKAILVCVALMINSTGVVADDSADGKKSLGGNGEMIRFDMPQGDRTLAGIQIHGSRYGTSTPPAEDFLIYVMNDQRTKVVATGFHVEINSIPPVDRSAGCLCKSEDLKIRDKLVVIMQSEMGRAPNYNKGNAWTSSK